MALETAKDKIRLSQIVGQKQEILSLDGDVIVNDVKPDVLKVISTTGTICVYKKEALNGKVKIEGCINTYIIYLADDEESSIRTINTTLDFAEIIDLEMCKEGMTVEALLCLKGFETKILNGRKLRVKAFVDSRIKVYDTNEVEAIIDVQNDDGDIQMLNTVKKILSLVGENTGKTTLKETINLNSQDELAEIMKISFGISNITTKTSYNKVLIKANANVNIMYLTEDNRIDEVYTTIPLMGFIDMPDVTDTSECISRVTLRNLVLRQNNEEENSINIEADIDLSCRAYEVKEINIIEDIYSISNDVKLNKIEVRTRQEEFELEDTIKVNQKLTIPDLLYGKVLGVNLTPTISNVDVRDGRIKYEATLNAEFMVQNENDINNVNTQIPFDFELSNNSITKRSNIETELNIVTKNIEVQDDGIVLDVELEVNAGVQNDENINFTQDLELMEPQEMDTYSMVIYFVKPGDTLWKIAKQFRTRVEDIARINGIEDENRIYPGQQLYIPKFTRKQLAI